MFDASGQPVRSPYLVREPVTGANVRLTLDAHLQKVAQGAIYRGMQIAHADRQYYADYGTRRRHEPRDRCGLRDGLVSELQAHRVGAAVQRPGRGSSIPRTGSSRRSTSRIAGTYPPGSTFKPITAVAAWMSGLIGPGSTRACTTLVPVAERPEPPQVLQLGPRELDHRALEGARDLVRHVLLPPRRRVLRPVPGAARTSSRSGSESSATATRRLSTSRAPSAGSSPTRTGRRTTRSS